MGRHVCHVIGVPVVDSSSLATGNWHKRHYALMYCLLACRLACLVLLLILAILLCVLEQSIKNHVVLVEPFSRFKKYYVAFVLCSKWLLFAYRATTTKQQYQH